MKKVLFFFSFITLIFANFPLYAADEQCPSIAAIKAVYSEYADPLPADGKMPYPIDMTDPNYEDRGGDVGGTYFVVTRVFSSDRGDGTPYVLFVIYANAAAGETRAQSISNARDQVNSITQEHSGVVDYPHFYMGEDEQTKVQYYFDVCLYKGNINKPKGSTDATSQDFDFSSPIVMADLSPMENANALNKDLSRLVKALRKAQANQTTGVK
jgi:hypothetical protein